jgi:ArsR family transcriptional regulator, arsenate/arsenite/antimonite-responsive transcriptional repressor
MRACISSTAKAAAFCCVRSRAIAACSVRTVVTSVRQFSWRHPAARLDLSIIVVIWYRPMDTQQVVQSLAALAHGHRLAVYRLLVERGPEGLSAGAIGEGVGLAPSSLTFHLQNLQRSGLLVQRRESRNLIYSVDFDAMNALVGYLTENCCVGSACATDCKPAKPAKARKRLKAA